MFRKNVIKIARKFIREDIELLRQLAKEQKHFKKTGTGK